MRCPKDDTDLVEVERQGIEIDYCPTCKGVWLDRRELDELINRSTANVSAGHADEPRHESRERSSGGMLDRARELIDDDRRDRDYDRSRRRRDRYDDDDDDYYEDRRRKGKKKKRKRDLLEDLFDF